MLTRGPTETLDELPDKRQIKAFQNANLIHSKGCKYHTNASRRPQKSTQIGCYMHEHSPVAAPYCMCIL